MVSLLLTEDAHGTLIMTSLSNQSRRSNDGVERPWLASVACLLPHTEEASQAINDDPPEHTLSVSLAAK